VLCLFLLCLRLAGLPCWWAFTLPISHPLRATDLEVVPDHKPPPSWTLAILVHPPNQDQTLLPPWHQPWAKQQPVEPYHPKGPLTKLNDSYDIDWDQRPHSLCFPASLFHSPSSPPPVVALALLNRKPQASAVAADCYDSYLNLPRQLLRPLHFPASFWSPSILAVHIHIHLTTTFYHRPHSTAPSP
jgi:hypothetical protein